MPGVVTMRPLTPYCLLGVLLLGTGFGVGLGLSEAPTQQATGPALSHTHSPSDTSVPPLGSRPSGSAFIPMAYRVAMPDVIGMQLGVACEHLHDSHLALAGVAAIAPQNGAPVPVDGCSTLSPSIVTAQRPVAGSWVLVGSIVTLVSQPSP